MAPPTTRRLATLSLAFGLAVAANGAARAQSANPAPAPFTVTMLGQGEPANAPGNGLELDRVTIAPGGTIPTHVHPGAYVLDVESGDFSFTVVKGDAQFTKAGSTAPQELQAGVETVGHAGDAFYENGGVVHTARNAGTTPVVLLTAGLLADDEPSLQPSNAEGTPTSWASDAPGQVPPSGTRPARRPPAGRSPTSGRQSAACRGNRHQPPWPDFTTPRLPDFTTPRLHDCGTGDITAAGSSRRSRSRPILARRSRSLVSAIAVASRWVPLG